MTVWGFDPLNWEIYQQNPQKAHPCVERRHMTYRLSKSVHQCDLFTWRRNQKWQWKTGYSPRPPTSSDRNTVWHGGWSSGSGCKFDVSSTTAERLPSCKGSKFGWSYYLGQWLIQQPYFVRPWLDRRPTGVSLEPCNILHLRCYSLTASLSPLRLLMTAKITEFMPQPGIGKRSSCMIIARSLSKMPY